MTVLYKQGSDDKWGVVNQYTRTAPKIPRPQRYGKRLRIIAKPTSTGLSGAKRTSLVLHALTVRGGMDGLTVAEMFGTPISGQMSMHCLSMTRKGFLERKLDTCSLTKRRHVWRYRIIP